MKFLYEGKTKKVYDAGDYYVLEFKDVFTAFDGKKVEEVKGKGEVNAKFTELLMKVLEEKGVPTHFVKRDGNKLYVKKAKPLPLEFIVRNYAYGSLLKRLPILEKGQELKRPVYEIHYKSDELHDPLLATDDPIAAGLLSEEQAEEIRNLTMRVNDILKEVFNEAGYKLIDFKVEYGITPEGKIILIDELSPDSFRAHKGEEIYDKDLFRKGASGEETLKRYLKLLEDLERVVA
ncbi:phosphoribosylaminoimidazole-succinocarboxamide synthase [Ignicoccus pacificus DSM 13166]|uniref:Phosphoribosylaminoimidazole-succinocarboxamide synthase n=1 Tax=Ignicoccus pacificus DSM 13166 TaxID=940294 RepID=A0A977KBH0_9CREN|nr:phosphoribosylaminoimidazole-succinocarboxamide synthase [Ignicoccus pacificus DSM 13166]